MDIIKWDGQPITSSGVYSGVPIDRYHNDPELFSCPAVSKSQLKTLFFLTGGSPWHFWQFWNQNPERKIRKPTKETDFGKAAHALVLGEEVFGEGYELRPAQWDDYTKVESRVWRDRVYAEGRTPVTVQDLKTIRKMARALEANRYVRGGILKGDMELTMVLKDPETGLMLKVRPDVLSTLKIFSDFKTAASLKEVFIRAQLLSGGYYLQGGAIKLVCEGLDIPFKGFVLVYCTKDEPFQTMAAPLDPVALELGQRMVGQGLKIIARCLETGVWPEPPNFNDGRQPIELLERDQKRIEEYLGTLSIDELKAIQAG
ncbi:PD-(D/E)XK nuclease-like domain-containing protein [Pseudovibrio ascidiaceicola]|uniref:PD-(D/E)XK nuclease-like domain-containing protein n=1 Tax=Pseudovibrio ascidiaceicola TaxID=285279 RepID=UPI003D368F25